MVQAVHQGISFKFTSLSWKEPAEFRAVLEGPDRKELRDLVAATGKRLEDCQAF